MDNAIDALKIAFAVMVFVLAISISMRVFSQAKNVSDEVFYMTDKTNFYEYTVDDETKKPEGRLVSGETIIPTLYRYYKENFNVIIGEDRNGDGILSGENEILWEFNLEKENKKYNLNNEDAPWLGNANIDTKTRVDVEVSGNAMNINGKEYKGQQKGLGIYEYVAGKKFLETFKEIRYSGKEITINEDGEIAEVGEGEDKVQNPEYEILEIVKGNTKIEITYKLVVDDNKKGE